MKIQNYTWPQLDRLGRTLPSDAFEPLMLILVLSAT
jgi:hypothetical protein